MDPITLSASVDAPRERVYATISDMGVRPSFTDHFQKDFRLARIESSGLGASARFRVSRPGPGKHWVETFIAAADPPRKLTEHGRCGRLWRIPVIAEWELEGGGGQTEVRLSFRTEPTNPFDRAVEKLGAARWYRRQWKKALRRLAEVVESGVEPVKVDVAGGDRAFTGVF